jgi:hypothetical protein
MDIQARNLALQAMYEHVARRPAGHITPSGETLFIVYGGTPNARDPMCRLLVDLYYDYREHRHPCVECSMEEDPEEFFLEYGMLAVRDGRAGGPCQRNPHPIKYDM